MCSQKRRRCDSVLSFSQHPELQQAAVHSSARLQRAQVSSGAVSTTSWLQLIGNAAGGGGGGGWGGWERGGAVTSRWLSLDPVVRNIFTQLAAVYLH